MGKRISKKSPGKTKAKANGSEPESPVAARGGIGDNVIIPVDELVPYRDRFLELANEKRTLVKECSDDQASLVTEMALALNVSKAAARAHLTDYVADVRRMERDARREETNPDTARDYERLAAAFGDSPMGRMFAGKTSPPQSQQPEEAAKT